jgi:hypothetical protein
MTQKETSILLLLLFTILAENYIAFRGGGGKSSELPLLGPEGGMILLGKILPIAPCVVDRGGESSSSSSKKLLLGPEGGMIFLSKTLPTSTSCTVDKDGEPLDVSELDDDGREVSFHITRELMPVRYCSRECRSKRGRASAPAHRSMVASSTSTAAGATTGGTVAPAMAVFLPLPMAFMCV